MGKITSGLYVRARNGLQLRDEKVRRLARSVRAALPWLTDADQPTVRGWSQLEVLADQAFAVLRVAGITSNGTEPRRLLTDFRQLKIAQLAYAQALGMSPAARLAIQVAGEDKAVDLAALALEHRDDATTIDAKNADDNSDSRASGGQDEASGLCAHQGGCQAPAWATGGPLPLCQRHASEVARETANGDDKR
jgi:hypothetical protein